MDVLTTALFLAVITALHFSIRLPRVSLVPKGIDALFHLLSASKFRRGRPPATLGKFLVGDEYTHPPLLHLMISFFPEHVRPKVLFLIGVASDFVLTVVAYFVALQFVSAPLALVASLIYCVTPASYISSVSESPRPLGAMWYSLTILLLIGQGLVYAVAATVTATLTMLSHKMATQTLFFTCLLMSPVLIGANPLFPLPLLFGFALALLLTRGRYLTILRDHAGIISFHLKYGSWNKRRKLPGSPMQLIKLQPFFFVPLIGLWVNQQPFLSVGVLMLTWYISLLVVFFAWIWGDADRYLTYSAVPVAVLSTMALNLGVNWFFLIPCLVVSGAMILRNSQVFFKGEALPDFSRIRVPEESVTLVAPSSLTYISALKMKGKILCGGSNATGLRFELETLPDLMSKDPNRVLEEYPITHMLLGPKHLDFIKPFESKFTPVMETNGYILYKRKQ